MRTTPTDADSTRHKALLGLSQETKEDILAAIETMEDAEADAYFRGILLGRDLERPRDDFERMAFPTMRLTVNDDDDR